MGSQAFGFVGRMPDGIARSVGQVGVQVRKAGITAVAVKSFS
jgi:hypothetical protein